MKRIRLKFISIYADVFGKELILELEDNMTVENLIEYLARELETRGIKTKPIVFINYRFPRESQILYDGDEVLVMPPFAGGRVVCK